MQEFFVAYAEAPGPERYRDGNEVWFDVTDGCATLRRQAEQGGAE